MYVCTYVRTFVRSFVRSLVGWLVGWFVCLFVCLFFVFFACMIQCLLANALPSRPNLYTTSVPKPKLEYKNNLLENPSPSPPTHVLKRDRLSIVLQRLFVVFIDIQHLKESNKKQQFINSIYIYVYIHLQK